MKYEYYNMAWDWPRRSVSELTNMVDNAIEITRQTFLKHCNLDSLDLGYAKHYKNGLTMAGDNYITYHRSKYKGQRCYFFKWSGIEYVFTNQQ